MARCWVPPQCVMKGVLASGDTHTQRARKASSSVVSVTSDNSTRQRSKATGGICPVVANRTIGVPIRLPRTKVKNVAGRA